MHPFLDGNGRTAQGAGGPHAPAGAAYATLGGSQCLISIMKRRGRISEGMAAVRASGHDLTPFLKFGLKGIAFQADNLMV